MKKTQIEPQAGILDLGIGQPSLSLLPLPLLRESSERVFNKADPSFLQYGPDEGSSLLRHNLAGFLSARFGMKVRHDSLFITNGISQAIDLVCTVFTKPGDTVIVEEPSYFFVFDIFRNHALRIESVPVGADGIDLDALEDAVKKTGPALLYTIPVFHNPTSSVLPGKKRMELVGLSSRYGFTVASDEAYQFLGYADSPPPSLALNDASGNVISIGSFSKILAPGLRLGWIQASPDFVSRLAGAGFVVSGGGLNPFAGEIVASAIESKALDAHVSFLRRTYSRRLEALYGALGSCVPSSWRFTKPGGGFFIWIELPGRSDTSSLLAKAIGRGVAFKPGCIFSYGSGLRNYLRLSFSYYEDDELAEAVARLCEAHETWIKNKPG